MRKLLFANWKMYLSDADAEELARLFLDAAASTRVDLAVAPSFTALDRVARLLRGSAVLLGAQDAFWMESGAYTGEVSAAQLAALGARYALVGHSERRAHLGETDEMVARKAAALSAAGIVPIVCIGETLEERAAGQQETAVHAQLAAVLRQRIVSAESPLIAAYEPRWAIGTGQACSPADIAAMHGMIRSVTGDFCGQEALPHLRVLYGGSVDAARAGGILAMPEVDGVLVGGASARRDEVLALLHALAQ